MDFIYADPTENKEKEISERPQGHQQVLAATGVLHSEYGHSSFL